MAAFTLRFLQVCEEWSSKGFGLMALAVGVLPNVHKLDLSVMSQQEIEVHAEGLQMLSMIVLTNNVRLDSRPSVTQLQERYHLCTCLFYKCCRITILALHPMSGNHRVAQYRPMQSHQHSYNTWSIHLSVLSSGEGIMQACPSLLDTSLILPHVVQGRNQDYHDHW